MSIISKFNKTKRKNSEIKRKKNTVKCLPNRKEFLIFILKSNF